MIQCIHIKVVVSDSGGNSEIFHGRQKVRKQTLKIMNEIYYVAAERSNMITEGGGSRETGTVRSYRSCGLCSP